MSLFYAFLHITASMHHLRSMLANIVRYRYSYNIYVKYTLLFLYNHHYNSPYFVFFAVAVAVIAVAVVGDYDDCGNNTLGLNEMSSIRI